MTTPRLIRRTVTQTDEIFDDGGDDLGEAIEAGQSVEISGDEMAGASGAGGEPQPEKPATEPPSSRCKK